MLSYEGAEGHVSYRSEASENAPETQEFSLWRRIGDQGPLRYVYVPSFRVELDPTLQWVRDEGMPAEDGHVVLLPRWNVLVDLDGRLREVESPLDDELEFLSSHHFA